MEAKKPGFQLFGFSFWDFIGIPSSYQSRMVLEASVSVRPKNFGSPPIFSVFSNFSSCQVEVQNFFWPVFLRVFDVFQSFHGVPSWNRVKIGNRQSFGENSCVFTPFLLKNALFRPKNQLFRHPGTRMLGVPKWKVLFVILPSCAHIIKLSRSWSGHFCSKFLFDFCFSAFSPKMGQFLMFFRPSSPTTAPISDFPTFLEMPWYVWLGSLQFRQFLSSFGFFIGLVATCTRNHQFLTFFSHFRSPSARDK